MKRFTHALLAAVVAMAAAVPTIAQKNTPDIGSHFRGFDDGCFVMMDLKTGTITRYNARRCAQPIAPCSTFKIFNSLVGLQTGVLRDENTTFKWDSTPQRLKEWEQDLTLAAAVKYSAVWYFQKVAAQVGPVRMQHYLDTVGYGNRDISGGITRFWLNTSLRISADDQVGFLARLYANRLPFDNRVMEVVRKVLVLRSEKGMVFSGKTGSAESTDSTFGWFVGHLTARNGHEYVFATNIQAKEGAFGPVARGVTEDILEELGLMKKQAAKKK